MPTAKKNPGLKNLPLSIEEKTRLKFIKQTKDGLDRLTGARQEAIHTLNTRRPLERARVAGYEGDGAILRESASNAGVHAFDVLMHRIEVQRAALARLILQADSWAAGELGVIDWDALDMDEDEEE